MSTEKTKEGMGAQVHSAQDKPLPCPFCGSPAGKHKNAGKDERWHYYCPDGCTTFKRLKEWNTRAALSTIRSTP